MKQKRSTRIKIWFKKNKRIFTLIGISILILSIGTGFNYLVINYVFSENNSSFLRSNDTDYSNRFLELTKNKKVQKQNSKTITNKFTKNILLP